MANNEYKSPYLDSLALDICFYLIYVISLYCDNQVEQLKANKNEGNSV